MTEQQLLALKRKVEEAKTTVSQLQGQQKALMKQLKDEWECSTVAQGQEKVKLIEKELLQITGEIEKGMLEIENKYEL